MAGSAEVTSALMIWAALPCAAVLAATSPCAVFAVSGWVAAAPVSVVAAGGSGRRCLGGERSRGCDGGGGDCKRGGRCFSRLRLGWCRRRSGGGRDDDGNGVGRHDGRGSLRGFGRIGGRGSVARSGLRRLVGFRAIGLRRVGLRFATAGRSGLGVVIRFAVGIGPGIEIAIVVACLVIARFVAAGVGGGVAIVRIVARRLVCPIGCGRIVARAVVGRSCVSSARRAADVLSLARRSLLLAAALLSTSAEKLSFPLDGWASDRADFAAAF